MTDAKITALTELTNPSADDLLVAVDDPGGTPVTKKVTRVNLGKGIIEPTAKTANYTVTANDEGLLGNASGGAFTFSLPAVSGTQGKRYWFKKIDSSGNGIIIDPDGSETIDGAANYELTIENESITIESTGAAWLIK